LAVTRTVTGSHPGAYLPRVPYRIEDKDFRGENGRRNDAFIGRNDSVSLNKAHPPLY
jgi:hypothetical protein